MPEINQAARCDLFHWRGSMPNLLRQMMMQARLMEGEPGTPGGGPATPVTPPAAPVTPPAKTGNPLLDLPIEEVPDQWREHARELRRENASLREKTKSIDEAAAQAKIDEAVRKAVEAQETKTKAIIDAEREASHRRIINSEVKGAALSIGLQDADAIKLIDISRRERRSGRRHGTACRFQDGQAVPLQGSACAQQQPESASA